VELSHPTGFLQQFPIPKRKRESISMDFSTRLPAANVTWFGIDNDWVRFEFKFFNEVRY